MFGKIVMLPGMCVLFFLLTTSCTKNTPENLSTQERFLRWSQEKIPTDFDWTACTTTLCSQHASLIAEGLTQIIYEQDTWALKAKLLDHWTALSDFEWELHLRKDVLWSDGKIFTTADVLSSWKRLLRHGALSRASVLFPILNAEKYRLKQLPFSKVGIEAIDSFTLRIRVRKKSPYFLWRLSHPATWPTRLGKAETLPRFTLGPFLIDRTAPGHRYITNRRYYKTIKLAGIEMTEEASPSARLTRFLNKESDLVTHLPLTFSSLIPTSVGPRFFPTTRLYALLFAPKLSREIRAKLLMALDRAEVIRLSGPGAKPSPNLFPLLGPHKGWPEHIKTTSPAKDLAALSSVLNLREGLALEYPPGGKELANNLQAQWQLRTEIPIRINPPRGFQKASSLADISIVTLDWSTYQPLEAYSQFLNNHPQLSLPQAASEPLNRIEKLLIESMQLFPLYYEPALALVQPEMRGYVWLPNETWDFSDLTL